MTSILDPSKKGTSIKGLIDPGGTIVKKVTGSDIALRAADPLNLVPKDAGPPSAEELSQLSSIRESGRTEAARILGSDPRKRKTSRSLISSKALIN